MKSHPIALAALALALAMPIGSMAQGRHDEKPHGATKPAAAATEQPRGTGGRHDEGGTTHGKKKVAAKKAPGKPDGAREGK